MGVDIPKDAIDGQTQHVHGIQREAIRLRPGADFDAEAELIRIRLADEVEPE